MVSNIEDNDAKDAGAMIPCGLPAAMDSASASKGISLMKLRSCSNQRNGLGARTTRPSSQVQMDCNIEDNDAKDAGDMTPCGLPAAMDSASASKATSSKKLRSYSNQRNEPGARTQRPSNQNQMDSDPYYNNAKDAGDMIPCDI